MVPKQGHLTKERVRAERGDHQLLALGTDAIELDATLLENKEHLARFFRTIEDAPLGDSAHGRDAVQIFHLARRQILKDRQFGEVTHLVRRLIQ